MSAADQKLFAYLMRLGDNALIMGQQLGGLVATGPELEEEMATANFALDYIGQARLFFSLAADIEGEGRSEDDLAFLRDDMDYHNVLLLERPNGDFAMTIARQFYFENFYRAQLESLQSSTEPRIAEIAAKASKEIDYHLRHTYQWLVRLGDGTEESHARMQAAINELWRFTGELFEPDSVESWSADNGIGPDLGSLKEGWLATVSKALNDATLAMPDDEWMAGGGKEGRHSEYLGYLLADMQYLQRAYPGASW